MYAILSGTAGMASDWIQAEVLKYRARLTAAEEVYRSKLQQQ